MLYTRREMGKLALMAVPAASLLERPFAALAQTRKPNSVIGGVSIGTITYSYRSMPDQSAQATLRTIHRIRRPAHLSRGAAPARRVAGPADRAAANGPTFRSNSARQGTPR